MSILDTQHDEGNSVPTHYNIKNELLYQFLNTEIQKQQTNASEALHFII